jgi:hypothetical protein
MRTDIDMGEGQGGARAVMDLEELLATRLLVQGNSGSGKSHLLRRLLEQSAPWVQQCVVDPEGDFVTLADRFGHLVVDGDRSEVELVRIAQRVREHRVSVVLNLEGLDTEGQMRCAAAFLGGLFDAERDQWYPMLVVVDEAQLFAPAAAGEVSDEARKVSLGAMTNLMCRGRKRGLAGVIATQRLAKLAKNVAAEASNFLMGRTFLDIDMARAADLLGMERRQAEMFRDLQRGHFVALGPALARRPLPVRIGPVETQPRATSPKLLPLPERPAEGLLDMIMEPVEAPMRASRPRPSIAPPPSTHDLLAQVAAHRQAAGEARTGEVPPSPATPEDLAQRDGALSSVMADILADAEAPFRSHAVLYQDFLVRCRILRIPGPAPDMGEFRRRLAVARAGREPDPGTEAPGRWPEIVAFSECLADDDARSVYLLLARAALCGEPCPADPEVARVFGSRSPGRAKRLLSTLEAQGAIVLRVDRAGWRAAVLPDFSLETAPGDPRGGAALAS